MAKQICVAQSTAEWRTVMETCFWNSSNYLGYKLLWTVLSPLCVCFAKPAASRKGFLFPWWPCPSLQAPAQVHIHLSWTKVFLAPLSPLKPHLMQCSVILFILWFVDGLRRQESGVKIPHCIVFASLPRPALYSVSNQILQLTFLKERLVPCSRSICKLPTCCTLT